MVKNIELLAEKAADKTIEIAQEARLAELRGDPDQAKRLRQRYNQAWEKIETALKAGNLQALKSIFLDV